MTTDKTIQGRLAWALEQILPLARIYLDAQLINSARDKDIRFAQETLAAYESEQKALAEFQGILDQPAKENPALRKLMTEPSVFEKGVAQSNNTARQEALDALYAEVDRRFRLPKSHDDHMQTDDTQIGVEFAYEFLTSAHLAPEQTAQVTDDDLDDALAYCEAKLRQSKTAGFKIISVLNKHLETLIRAAQSHKSDWMSIDSAPMDGTKFTALHEGKEVTCWWYNHPSVSGWITDAFDCNDYEFNPTHWKPLDAPKKGGG